MMSLNPGSRLGLYEIVAPIGAGGMGEVYRARDTKLGRDVAIKVLPEAFAGDRERRLRFEREAQTLAVLNHPRIATIYGVADEAGTSALVMELVDGLTFAERLKTGPLPIDEAVALAVQLAEALEYAHDRGIVHRDLKPANLKLTPDGAVKVLDFGLAKALDDSPGAFSMDNSPTISAAATRAGVILGTAAYMAPEQARGAAVDRRADVWAFGCVLYEMLTGSAPFSGDTVSDTMAAVLRAEVEWSRLPAETPPNVRRLLRRCLEKDVKRRLRDMGDARLELEDVSVSAGDAAAPSTGHSTGSIAIRYWKPALILVLIAAAFAAGVWRRPRPVAAVQYRGEVLGGPAISFSPRVSPNGEMVAFAAMVDGLTQVAVSLPQSGQWRILTTDRSRGTAGMGGIAWTPDNSEIYFDRSLDDRPGGIYRVPVLGGEARQVVPDATTPEPLPDGSLLVVRIDAERRRVLFRFRPETRQFEPLNALFPANLLSPALRAFPDGREAVFYGRPLDKPDAPDHIYKIDLGSNQVRALAPSVNFGNPSWGFPLAVTKDEVLFVVHSGDLNTIAAVARDGSEQIRTITALPGRALTLDSGADGRIFSDVLQQPVELIVSPPRSSSINRVSLGVVSDPEFLLAPYPLPDGRILIPWKTAGQNRVVALTTTGAMTPFLDSQEPSTAPISTVGRDHVALMLGSARRTMALVSIADGHILRRFDIQGAVQSIAGAPDGRKIYYSDHDSTIWAIAVDGGTPQKIGAGDFVAMDPDGRSLVVSRRETQRVRLVRIRIDRSTEEEIPRRGDLPITNFLAPNAVHADGRIVVRSALNWYWPAAIVDPRSGLVEQVWPNIEADMMGAWMLDGRVAAIANLTYSNLWRFTPEK